MCIDVVVRGVFLTCSSQQVTGTVVTTGLQAATKTGDVP